MANKAYEETAIQAIANAIRAKNGTTDTYTVAQMAAAIEAIEAGGGGINATAGTVTVTADCNNYVLTHGLGEIPKLFAIMAAENFSKATGKSYILAGAWGDDTNGQYRVTSASSSSAPTGVFRDVKITGSSSRVSLEGANSDTIKIAGAASTYQLIAGLTYHWIAVGSGVFA